MLNKKYLSLYLLSMMLSPVAHASSDLDVVLERYERWALGASQQTHANPATDDLAHLQVRRCLAQLIKLADKTLRLEKRGQLFHQLNKSGEVPGLFNTTRKGRDSKELSFLIDHYLPGLSRAYQMKGTLADPNPHYQSEIIKELIFKGFDHLHMRGFRKPMLMPYKSSHLSKVPEEQKKKHAIVVDYHLRTAGYAYATFLMRKELKASGRLMRTLETCREVLTHGEKTGDLSALHQNADALRILVNFALPYALAAGDTERLALIKKQFDYSLMKGADDYDTIKPDGLGFHHRAGYFVGYAGYTMCQSAFMAWLLQGTNYALSAQSVDNIHHSLSVIRLLSQKYDMHKSQSGRLKPISIIPRIMLGYLYLADLNFKGRDHVRKMLARLADKDFTYSPKAYLLFYPQRSENTPGPGLIHHYYQVLEAAWRLGAEPDPSGHWSFPYGPLTVHRRDNWMVSQKGQSEYFWTFERSMKDARLDERLENVLGYHDSSASLYIYGQGEPVNAVASGYFGDGWDWSRIPGTTTRYLPPADLVELTKKGGGFNRPFGESTFAGGLTHKNPMGGDQGIFSMIYTEVTPESAKPTSQTLRAIKSSFYFDDQIVMLTSDIHGGDTDHEVISTLFQNRLPDHHAATWANGEAVTSLHEPKNVARQEAVTLMDVAGNGYYIPQGQRVMTQRIKQSSYDRSATKKVQGLFASAWLTHGRKPKHEKGEYVILVQTDPDKLAAFSKRAPQVYEVLQQDHTAHVVRHHEKRMTGYAVLRSGVEVKGGLIAGVDTPCLVMAQALNDLQELAAAKMQVSVCNPDMGWTRGKQYRRRGKERGAPRIPFEPVPMPVKLTLKGAWELVHEHPEVTLQADASRSNTEITIRCRDGKSTTFQLKRGGHE